MRKTAQEASNELMEFRNLLMEDPSTSQLDTGALLAKAILLFTEMEQNEVNKSDIAAVMPSFCSGFEIKIFESNTIQEGKAALIVNPKNMPRKNEA